MARKAISRDQRSQAGLIDAAGSGDQHAFRLLAEPYYRELHVHCYRMLGSVEDAEDLVQETLLRAWKRLDTFETRGSVRAWLYRVATNACLNELDRRTRRLPPPVYGPPTDSRGTHTPFSPEILHLQPYPDALLDRRREDAVDPEARSVSRENIELAFLAAIQLLPPRQRAVLLLRDVIGWAASEVAELLDTSVAAVNSALQRARAALARHSPRLEASAPPTGETEASILRRYMLAWERADMDALANLLREDAILTMPPAPSWYLGRDSIIEFFSTFPWVFGDT